MDFCTIADDLINRRGVSIRPSVVRRLPRSRKFGIFLSIVCMQIRSAGRQIWKRWLATLRAWWNTGGSRRDVSVVTKDHLQEGARIGPRLSDLVGINEK